MAQIELELDLLGQQPRINQLYTQLTFCFEVTNVEEADLASCQRQSQPGSQAQAQSNLLHNLALGVQRLSKGFPWIVGRVSYCQDGVFRICFSSQETALRMTIKDLTTPQAPQFPSWQRLRDAGFPFSMLDEALVAPCNTLAVPDATVAEVPVFLVQINLVHGGGLLLTVNGQHGAMDMGGQSSIISLFAKACRGEDFTPEELRVGNMDRKNALSEFMSRSFTDSMRATLDQSLLSTKGVSQAAPTIAEGRLCWCYFAFSPESLAELKSSASRSIPSGTFISTDDVLSALTWKSITRAHQPRFIRRDESSSSSAGLTTTLLRNVDMRRFIGLPTAYPGFITDSAVNTDSAVETLVEQPVGEIAHRLRIALDPQSLTTHFHTQLTAIETALKHKNGSNSSILTNPALDVRLSSWAKEKCYDFDFGPVLGKAVAVRRPKFIPGAREGLVYFLPKRGDGEIVVGVCLGENDMGRLVGQDEWAKYGRCIG